MPCHTYPARRGKKRVSQFAGRRLSVLRLLVVVIVAFAVVVAALRGWRWFRDDPHHSADDVSWPFSGYVDATLTPTYAFEQPLSRADRDVVLGFVVADPHQACTPSWGAAYSLDQASTSLDLDRRIARLRQIGGQVTVSFGGEANTELADSCTDVTQLTAAYRSVVDRYELSTIDLDVEGAALTDSAGLTRRAQAIAALQHSKQVGVWLTLPVAPTGLTDSGLAAVRTMLAAGVDLTGVNVMTMDYGGSLPAGTSMGTAAVDALQATHRQLGSLYAAAGHKLSSAALWQHLGATPMIGQNDVAGEIFSHADAVTLRDFAGQVGLGRVSLWSLNRDEACGPNYPDVTIVSNECSGVDQQDGQFATVLAGGPSAGASSSAAATPTPTSSPTVNPTVTPSDDPATSPYPIWRSDGIYLEGDHVVWHQNVYVAKWWTSGDQPDDPVASGAATPWTLLGPVLPGETPQPTPTVPAGTYPAWSQTAVYRAGDRVLYQGSAYVAQWYTQGRSPLDPSTTSDPSPWRRLTPAQVKGAKP
jgi:chitinase